MEILRFGTLSKGHGIRKASSTEAKIEVSKAWFGPKIQMTSINMEFISQGS
jgi:hypothetical protein